MKAAFHIALILVALLGQGMNASAQLFGPILHQVNITCAQAPMTTSGTDVLLANLENALYFDPNAEIPTPSQSIRSGHLTVELMTSGQHQFGSTAFDASLSFRVRGYVDAALQFDLPYTLTIDEDHPQQRVRLNLNDLNAISDISHIQIVRVNDGDLVLSGIHESRIAFHASTRYEMSYAFPAEAVAIAAPVAASAAKNEVRFTWDFPVDAPNYPLFELQILRLFETQQAEDFGLNRTVIDWNQATSITTTGKGLVLALCEGSGFYIWRVRPYTDFYEPEATHPKNWGSWSDHTGLQNGSPTLNIGVAGALSTGADMYVQGTSLNSPAIFYYEQFDAERNWIFSRTFTDGRSIGNGATATRFGEKITYATALQQVDQTLVRTGTTMLASQSVLDLVGRPALSSLPVPIEENKTLGYIPFLMDPVETGAQVLNNYNALDFDTDGTVLENRPVNDAGTLFSYYSPNGTAAEVPSAMGYPFSRTLFNADGSVQQASGPGLPFAFNDAAAPPLTSKTYHLGTTTAELARIFGEEMYHPNTVHQVLTVDPNGVMSSAYVDKEGKTLASSIIKADNYAFDDPNRTLLPLPSEESGTYSITTTLGANIEVAANVVEATALVHTDLPGQQVVLHYDLDINSITEDCSDFCTTCDYTVEFTLVNQQQPDGNLLENLMPTQTVSPLAGVCSAQFTDMDPTITIDVPGTYVLTRRITTNNPLQPNTTNPTYLDQHLANVLDGLEPDFQEVDDLLAILQAPDAELSNFFDALEIDPEVATEFTIDIGCTPVTIPVTTCEPCLADMQTFVAHLQEQYDITRTAYNDDPDNTNDIPAMVVNTGSPNGHPILTYTGTGGDDVQFSFGQLQSLLTNMLAEPEGSGYSCEELRACWIAAVSAYTDALANTGTNTITVQPPPGSEAEETMGSATLTLHIMDLFLKCTGKHIQGFSSNASGNGVTPIPNNATNNQSTTYGYLTHAYAFMYLADEPEVDVCYNAVIDGYQTATPPSSWHTEITFTFDNADDYVTTGWDIYYECVLGQQMAGLIGFDGFDVNSGETVDLEAHLEDLHTLCYERCEDRRESFEYELWTLFSDLDPNSVVDQATIECSVDRLVDQCLSDCNAVQIIVTPSPDEVDYLGPQSALERVQLIVAGNFDLAEPENGDCPEGFEPVNMNGTNEPDPSTFPTNAQMANLLNDELNNFVLFALDFVGGEPSTYQSSTGWSANPNGSVALRTFPLPGSDCNEIRMQVHIGWAGGNIPLLPCTDPAFDDQSFGCLYRNQRTMSITDINIQLINDPDVQYDLVDLAFGGEPVLNSGLAPFGNMPTINGTPFTSAFGRFQGSPITYQFMEYDSPGVWLPSDPEFDITLDTPLNISLCGDDFQSPLLHGFDFTAPSWGGGLQVYCNEMPTTMALPQILSQPGLGCPALCPGSPVCIKWSAGMGLSGEVDVIGLMDCESIQLNHYIDLLQAHRTEIQDGLLAQFATDYMTTCADPDQISDNLTATTTRNQHHYTLYYYDRAGNLISTIPPEGVKTMTGPQAQWPTTETAHQATNGRDHRTRYIHNSLGQVVEQTTPNGGTVRMFYDAVGRLRLSQNAQQVDEQRYAYTKYDPLGRVVEAGVSTVWGIGGSVDAMLAAPNLTEFLSGNQNFPATGTQKLTTTYTAATVGLTYLDGSVQRNLLNRVASSASDVDGLPGTPHDRIVTHYSYDPHGNVEWLVQDIPFLGKQYAAYTYDLISGRVLQVRYNEGRPDQFFHRYSYDTEGRIELTETSCDGLIWDRDADYAYYAHGPLERSVIGQDKVQGVDYSYTIQGWLKGINDHRLNGNDVSADGLGNSTVGRDAFGMMLSYFQDDYEPSASAFAGAQPGTLGRDLYNGNITAWAFNSQLSEAEMTDATLPYMTDEALAFSYHYDVLNRLRNAQSQGFNTAWADHANDRFNSSHYYDANGNFTQGPGNQPGTLRRDANGALMDEIDYTYAAPPQAGQPDHPDRLTSINENIDGMGDDLKNDHTYAYDKIGQLTQETWDQGTSTNTIYWNASGKVARVALANGRHLLFLYDAAGHRTLKAEVGTYQTALQTPAAGDVFTYYVRDAQGNPMATYDRTVTPTGQPNQLQDRITLTEQPIYGSSRLGVRTSDVVVAEGLWNSGVFQPTTPEFTFRSEVDHLQINSSVRLDLTIFGFPFNLPLQTGFHTEPTPVPTFTGEFAAAWATESHNTYRAENLQGELVFKTHFISFPAPNAAFSRLHVQDANGNLVFNSNGLISTNTTPTLSAQNPLNDQQHFLFTMDALGRPYYNVFDRSLTGNGSLGEFVPPYNRALWNVNELYAPCMAVIDDRTGFAPPVLYLKRRGLTQSHVAAIDLNVLAANGTAPQIILASYNAVDPYGVRGELQLSPDGKYLAVSSRFMDLPGTVFPPSDPHQVRVYRIDPDHLGLTPLGAVTTGNIASLSSLDFSPESAYLYYVQTAGIDGSRLYRIPVPGLTPAAAVNPAVRYTEVRRLKGDRMLCTNVIPSGGQRNVYVLHDPNAATTAAVAASSQLVWALNTSFPFSTPRLSPHVALQPLIIHNEKSIFTRTVDKKRYELTDHLGNVRSVVSDRLLADYDFVTNDTPTNLRAKVVSRSDYFPFGSLLPVRNANSTSDTYRFAFQGQESDKELNGERNSYAFEYRMHDPRVGRFLSIDPLASKYPQWAPYVFSGNQVISSQEIEGLEPKEDLNQQSIPSTSNLSLLGTATGVQSSPKNLVTTDAGHGDRNNNNTVVDPGAVDGTHYEKDYALMVETEINRWLTEFGVVSDRTRSADKDVRPGGPINWRWEAANKSKSSVFVSVHLNSGTSCDAFAVYQQGKGSECDSKALGGLIMGRLGTMFDVPSNNVRPVNGYTRFNTLGILNNFSGQSGILLELGGIGSQDNRTLILTRSSDIGREIATGIYLHMFGKMPTTQ